MFRECSGKATNQRRLDFLATGLARFPGLLLGSILEPERSWAPWLARESQGARNILSPLKGWRCVTYTKCVWGSRLHAHQWEQWGESLEMSSLSINYTFDRGVDERQCLSLQWFVSFSPQPGTVFWMMMPWGLPIGTSFLTVSSEDPRFPSEVMQRQIFFSITRSFSLISSLPTSHPGYQWAAPQTTSISHFPSLFCFLALKDYNKIERW